MSAVAPTFHLYLPQMRLPIDAIAERAVAAEVAGFEGIAFMDHLAPPLALDQPMWDAMAVATWALARTTTLLVGHLVLCDAFRHPAVLAREVTTLDHASGGRFELGIGWGSVPTEFTTFGVAPTEPRDRVARLGESLAILRGLWSGDPVDHDGEHFQVVGAQQRPTPTRPIPLTIGGVGRRTLALVREHADWWNVPIHQLDRVDELRDQAGNARLSVQTMVAFAPDASSRDEVEAAARRRFAGTQMGERLVAGTATELAAHFTQQHAAGVDRFYVWFADFAPVDTVAGFGAVIAALS